MVKSISLVSLALPLLWGSSSAGRVPQRRADICGTKGYDRGQGNYDYNDSGKYSTYTACSARCAASAECKSFGYGGKVCMLFDIPLAGNFDADKGSSDTYYDIACISGATTSSGPVTTTTTTKPTTTTTTTTTKAPTTTTTTTTKAPTATTTTTTKGTTSTTKPSTISTNLPTAPPVTTTATPTTTTSIISIPASCTNIQPTMVMTSFTWINTTHNLDCVNPNYPAGSTVCWNSNTNTLCNSGDAGCTCTPFCYTGLPSAAYQPLGYGPRDSISIGFSGNSPYYQVEPKGYRDYELGTGHFDGGSAADFIGFYGDSNKDSGNVGSVYFNGVFNTCGGRTPRYTASFPLVCSHDAGFNATCTTNLPVVLNLESF
ncbi:hypothetical protein K461DRAFT_275434 [Myriangium duriaei CBS 260.36]|uniref:Apple domain-containing protein n=1 Tax=Myriangium duriaei CBS 260.36 TaxID=1168546 RepID=A0A9P4JAX0_9PEZI|nr:hypothetical protein K461DRAFT_275434 [Myriangium duriaei CBS 260.36]